MQELLNFFVIYFLGALIFYYYCERLFELRRGRLFQIIALAAAYLLQFLAVFLKNSSLNILVYVAVNTVYILLAYKAKPFSALFYTTIAAILMGMGEVLVVAFNKEFFYDVYTDSSNTPYFMFLSLISKLIYFMLIVLILKFKKFNKRTDNADSNNILLIVIPILSCVVLISFGSIYIHTVLGSRQSFLLFISSSIVIVINILIFLINDSMSRQNRELHETEMRLQSEKDRAEYFISLKNENEARDMLIHDIKKELRTISDLNKENKKEQVNEMIVQILGSEAFNPSRRVSDNTLLNSIVGRYITMCEEKNIELILDIRSGAVNFLSDRELSVLFYNLLDNAFESASQFGDGAFIELNIRSYDRNGRVDIIMSNSCKAAMQEEYEALPESTKSDKSKHGLGLKSTEKIIKKYNGHLNLSYDEEGKIFHTSIFMNP